MRPRAAGWTTAARASSCTGGSNRRRRRPPRSTCASRALDRLAGPNAAQLAGEVREPAAVHEQLAGPAGEGADAAAEQQAGQRAGVAGADGGGPLVDQTVADDVDAARARGGRELRAVTYAVVVGERAVARRELGGRLGPRLDRKSTRLNSSHLGISYAVFCLKKK